MGSPKLLLPYRQATVIDQVLKTWVQSQVDDVVVVCRRSDHRLIDRCVKHDCTQVLPKIDPPDMKSSVLHAIDFINDQHDPLPTDGWFLTPADTPSIETDVISNLCKEFRSLSLEWPTSVTASKLAPPEILVPVVNNRRGHPVLFPWSLASAVREIPNDQGVNQLLRRYPVREIQVKSTTILEDLDTPEEYRKLLSEFD